MKRTAVLLAGLMVLGAPLAALAKKDKPEYRSTPVVPVQLGTNTCAVKLLIDREEIFPEALQMLESAQKEILLNIYIFGGFDNFTQGKDYVGIGKAMCDIMARKVAEGVTVRIVTPEPGDMARKQNWIKSKIVEFRNKIRGFLKLPDLPPPAEPGHEPTFEYAREKGIPILGSNVGVLGGSALWKLDHSKLLIVDGKDALIGGMNFAECVASNHDGMTRLAGPIVKELKAIFANAWDYSLQKAEFDGEVQIPAEWKDAAALAACDDAAIKAEFDRRVAEGWPTAEISNTLAAPYIYNTRPKVLELVNSTSEGDQIMVEMLLLTDKPCIQALIEAHRRGVDVRVILDPNESLYGINCMGAPNIIAVRDFIEADLPVRDYEPEPGQELHLKMILVSRKDGTAEFAMGSTNWTVGAFDSNFEMFAFYKNCPAVTDRMKKMFEHDWTERSKASGHPPKVGAVDATRGSDAKDRHLSLLQKMIEAFVDCIDQKIF